MKIKSTITIGVFFLILCIYSCKGQEKIDYNSFIEGSEYSINKKEKSVFDRLKHYKVPGVSIAVINNGVIDWARGFGVANIKNKTKVNKETLFQAASISKPFTALAVLKLLEERKIELDEDVNTYLKDWKVPKNEFTEIEKVTLRRLLTHTAGVTVHGFPGYRQKKSLPSTLMVLNGKGNTSVITIDTIPGSIWRYSGGGYTIIQKLIEDVSGISFAKYMDKNILEPMGMNNSTFQQPLPSNLHSKASEAYNSKGKMIKGLWHNYPEQAAAGLWTTPTDLAKYCIEIQQILSGKSNGFLSKATIEMMLTKHKNNWGLGLFVESEGNSLRFAHGGTNEGFNANLFSFAYQGKAIIVMTNGDNGKKLINEIHRSIFEFYQW